MKNGKEEKEEKKKKNWKKVHCKSYTPLMEQPGFETVFFFFYSIDECMYQEQSLIYTHAELFEY